MAIDKIIKDGDTYVHTIVETEEQKPEVDAPVETTNEDGSVEVEATHAPFFTTEVTPEEDVAQKKAVVDSPPTEDQKQG